MKLNKILLFVMLILMLFSFNSCNKKTNTKTLKVNEIDKPLLPLKASGTNLEDINGNIIQLCGVNLGGWLVFEEWMCPVYDGNMNEPKAAGKDIYNILLSRFSEDKVDKLVETYQDNWITEYDLDYLQSIGVNCVRVPFWYKNFQNHDGSWKFKSDGEIDFSRFDWLVEKCGERGIYVILDLHGAFGFQSVAHHSGANNDCHLFDDTPEGEEYRNQTVFLWRKIAEHFNGCAAIAGFDLLNEPYCDMILDNVAYRKINNMYDMLYKAVRDVNKETPLIMEAMWRLEKLPAPVIMGWENVIYEVHFYGYTTKEAVDESKNHLIRYSKLYNVPVYVGEFECGDCEAYAIESYFGAGASYTIWTYKGSKPDKQWFLRYPSIAQYANIVEDSYNEILEKWGTKIQTEYSGKGLLGFKKTYSFNVNKIIEDAIINNR